MKLSQIGEFGLIEQLAKVIGKPQGDVVVGIGDDAAALQIPRTKIQDTNKSQISNSKLQKLLLITTDALVEKVHFRKGDSFFHLGQKAMAVNVSDIAAMGGVPTYALVTIGASKNTKVSDIKALYQGLTKIAKQYKVQIIGGDTVRSRDFIISITLMGEVEKECLVTRAGAKVGDLICVMGKFGGEAARRYKIQGTRYKQYSISKFQTARKIAKFRLATAMIDSSDGLMRSISEICKASKVGAKIQMDSVPVAKGASLKQALYGGEEYELVFTVPRSKVKKLKIAATVIGEIVSKKNGMDLEGGFEHFRK